MKITDSATEEIIGIFLNYFALFAFFAANRNNKGVVQLRCLGLAYIRQLKPQKVHFTIENIDPNQHSSFHPLGERPKYYIVQCFQG